MYYAPVPNPNLFHWRIGKGIAPGGTVAILQVWFVAAVVLIAFVARGDDQTLNLTVSGKVHPTEHTNRLAGEKSPYLLQHQHNPVDWYPWGEEAFRKARRENKPIFLSIGYSTCHWCHVMERESFESKQTADFLNAHFVS